MSASIRIGSETFSVLDPKLQEALASAHEAHERPVCLCTETGAPLYIAHIGDAYWLKRMPGTGDQHAQGCSAFESPTDLTGKGVLVGSAIREEEGTDTVNLALAFPLKTSGNRKAPEPGEGEQDTVKGSVKKLSLLALLHYLWDEAGLTQWRPGFEGKRSWGAVHRRLLGAAENKQTKTSPLTAHIFVPEPFFANDKDDIRLRRVGKIARFVPGAGAKSRPLLIVVGRLKGLVRGSQSTQMSIKHMPDFYLDVSDNFLGRFKKRYESQLDLIEDPDSRLKAIIIAVVSVRSFKAADVLEAGLMLVNEHYLPVENTVDQELVDTLIRKRRIFTKGLKYNLGRDYACASAILQDTDPSVALYILPSEASDELRDSIAQARQSSALETLVWDIAAGGMPPIPAKAAFRSATSSPNKETSRG